MFFKSSCLIILGLAIAVSSYELTLPHNFREPYYKKIGEYEWHLDEKSYVSHYFLPKLYQIQLYKNWNDASNECKNNGGQLAVFETEEEQDYVLNNLPDDRFVYNPDLKTTISIGGIKKADSWYWRWSNVDEAINYKINWARGEPDNDGGDEDCLSIYNADETFRLTDESCSRVSRFLCEIYESTDNIIEENYRKIGKSEWKHYGTKYISEYYLWRSTKPYKNWNDAFNECKNIGGQLAVFETEEEQDYVLKNLPADSIMTDKQYLSEFFISIGGIKKRNKWYWRWPDADGFISYRLDWASGEPNNAKKDETCLNIYKANGSFKLNDDSCVNKRGQFLCEKQVPVVNIIEENYSLIGNFEWNIDDTHFASNYFLWKSTEPSKNWNDAFNECKNIGGQLAAFETEEEQDYVLNNLPADSIMTDKQYLSEFFISIGGIKKGNKWYWRWSDSDDLIKYKINWAPGEPNNAKKDETCLNIYKANGSFKLNDDSCINRIGQFLCEKQEIIGASETNIAQLPENDQEEY